MSYNKMSQSEIDALLKDSDFEDSAIKDYQNQSGARQIQNHYQSHQQQQEQQKQYQPNNNIEQTSNDYGQDEFESYQQSKRSEFKSRNLMNKNLPSQKQAINELQNYPQQNQYSAYDSYAQDQFESYQQSRKTKEFERSYPKNVLNKNNQTHSQKTNNQNLPDKNTQIDKKVSFQQPNQRKPQQQNYIQTQQQNYRQLEPSTNTNKKAQLIKTSNQTQKQSSTIKSGLIKNQQVKENKNLPYNYTRLQQRQKELLFTSLAQENKKLKQILAERDKQITSTKMKYNILLEEKAQVLGNAKEATLKKQLEMLQTKYDNVLKQKAKQRTHKTVQMSKTMNNNFVLQQQAQEREQELLIIVEKLKQRLVSTDKQLKTLQQKMNEGLNYQQELQRKLKRVEQLELRMQKMKIQADQDRALIQMLKEKAKEQKNKIQQLQQEKNELNLSLKRAEMTQATQNDFKHELQEVKREKQLLQKSLKQISMNFTTNLTTNAYKIPKRPELQDIIQDSNELLSYKKK